MTLPKKKFTIQQQDRIRMNESIESVNDKIKWNIEHWNPIDQKYQSEKVSSEMIKINEEAIKKDKYEENKLDKELEKTLGRMK